MLSVNYYRYNLSQNKYVNYQAVKINLEQKYEFWFRALEVVWIIFIVNDVSAIWSDKTRWQTQPNLNNIISHNKINRQWCYLVNKINGPLYLIYWLFLKLNVKKLKCIVLEKLNIKMSNISYGHLMNQLYSVITYYCFLLYNMP